MPGSTRRRERELKRAIEELKLAKQQLSRELALLDSGNELEGCLRVSDIAGFKLSNLQSVSSGDERAYSAVCKELSFYIQVNMKEYTVRSLNIVVNEISPLREIHSDLLRLSQELCPDRVMQAIQQFVHLKNFRTEVFKILNGRFFFSDISNDYQNEFGQQDRRCDIWVYHSNQREDLTLMLELQWRISWNWVVQGLAHQFCIKYAVGLPQVNIFLGKLQNTTYSIYDSDEKALMQIWSQFNEYVCSTSSLGYVC